MARDAKTARKRKRARGAEMMMTAAEKDREKVEDQDAEDPEKAAESAAKKEKKMKKKRNRKKKKEEEGKNDATTENEAETFKEGGKPTEDGLLTDAVRDMEDARLPACFGESFRASRGHLTRPTEVQSVTWPAALEGRDILGVAPTGSGKSIAYILPALAHVLDKQRRAKAEKRTCSAPTSPSVMTLLPTRELAKQACATAHRFCKPYLINCLAAYGGKDRAAQVERLRGENLELVFATPGRALDLVRGGELSLESTTLLVLDECDRMLDMGFEPQLREFVDALRKHEHGTQHILLSATFPAKLQRVLEDLALLAKDPLRFRVAPSGAVVPLAEEAGGGADDGEEGPTEAEAAAQSAAQTAAAAQGIASSITQIVQVCAEHKKPMKLAKFLDKVDAEDREQNRLRNPSSILIFCTKIKTVKFVESFLRKQNAGPASGKDQNASAKTKGKGQDQQSAKRRCVALHGSMTQSERERALRDFRAGKARILVATDVAGRGIDIKGLPFVVNYDFPGSLEVYVHRVGRTGRQDRPGVAYSFFTRNMAPLAPSLIDLLKASQQKVDPFLQRLVDQGEDDPDLKKIRERQQKRRRKTDDAKTDEDK